MRTLIVEDEVNLAEIMKKKLTQEHFIVDLASDGEEGVNLLFMNEYDIIILDLMLPKKDGLTVLSELRKGGIKTPVLILTARDRVEDKVKGLNAGADDYLTKPFAFEELLARMKALLRREIKEETNLLKNADLVLDTQKYAVTRGAKEITLTLKEYSLLEYLLRNKGYTLTRGQIEEHVWGDIGGNSNLVDVYIRFLRRKIDEDFDEKLIETVRGRGYRMRVIENED